MDCLENRNWKTAFLMKMDKYKQRDGLEGNITIPSQNSDKECRQVFR